MARGYGAYNFFLVQLMESVDGKNSVEVLKESCSIEIGGHMAHYQIIHVPCIRNNSIITSSRNKRRVTAAVQTTTSFKGEATITVTPKERPPIVYERALTDQT